MTRWFLAVSWVALAWPVETFACVEAVDTQPAHATFAGITVDRCCDSLEHRCVVAVTSPDGGVWTTELGTVGGALFILSPQVVVSGSTVLTPDGAVNLWSHLSPNEQGQLSASATTCGVRFSVAGLVGAQLKLVSGTPPVAVYIDAQGQVTRTAPVPEVCSPELATRWAQLDERSRSIVLSDALTLLRIDEPLSGELTLAQRPCLDALMIAAAEPTLREFGLEALLVLGLKNPSIAREILAHPRLSAEHADELTATYATAFFSLSRLWQTALTLLFIGGIIALFAVVRRRPRSWLAGSGVIAMLGVGLGGLAVNAHHAAPPTSTHALRVALMSHSESGGDAAERCTAPNLQFRHRQTLEAALGAREAQLEQCLPDEATELRVSATVSADGGVIAVSAMSDPPQFGDSNRDTRATRCAAAALADVVVPPAVATTAAMTRVVRSETPSALVIVPEPNAESAPTARGNASWSKAPEIIAVQAVLARIDAAPTLAERTETGCLVSAQVSEGRLTSGTLTTMRRRFTVTAVGSRGETRSHIIHFAGADQSADDVATRIEYQSPLVEPVFVYDAEVQLAADAPKRIERRFYFSRGVPVLLHERGGPTFSTRWAHEKIAGRPIAAPADTRWAAALHDQRQCAKVPELLKWAVGGNRGAVEALSRLFPQSMTPAR